MVIPQIFGEQPITCDQDSVVECHYLGMWCMSKNQCHRSLHTLTLQTHHYQLPQWQCPLRCKTCIPLENQWGDQNVFKELVDFPKNVGRQYIWLSWMSHGHEILPKPPPRIVEFYKMQSKLTGCCVLNKKLQQLILFYMAILVHSDSSIRAMHIVTNITFCSSMYIEKGL
jgi:hypothetical protein